jgi:hypothetical protein
MIDDSFKEKESGKSEGKTSTPKISINEKYFPDLKERKYDILGHAKGMDGSDIYKVKLHAGKTPLQPETVTTFVVEEGELAEVNKSYVKSFDAKFKPVGSEGKEEGKATKKEPAHYDNKVEPYKATASSRKGDKFEFQVVNKDTAILSDGKKLPIGFQYDQGKKVTTLKVSALDAIGKELGLTGTASGVLKVGSTADEFQANLDKQKEQKIAAGMEEMSDRASEEVRLPIFGTSMGRSIGVAQLTGSEAMKAAIKEHESDLDKLPTERLIQDAEPYIKATLGQIKDAIIDGIKKRAEAKAEKDKVFALAKQTGKDQYLYHWHDTDKGDFTKFTIYATPDGKEKLVKLHIDNI